MLRVASVVFLCACTSVPRVPATSAASEDASAAPLPTVAVALSEDAPLADAGEAPMEHHHHHGGDHAP